MNPPLSLSRTRPFELFLSINPYNESHQILSQARLDAVIPILPPDLIPGLSLRAGLGVGSDFRSTHRYEMFIGLRYSFSDLVQLQLNLNGGYRIDASTSENPSRPFLEPQLNLNVTPWEAMGFFLQLGYVSSPRTDSQLSVGGGLSFNLESVRRYVNDEDTPPPAPETRRSEEATSSSCPQITPTISSSHSEFEAYPWLDNSDRYLLQDVIESIPSDRRNLFRLELRSSLDAIHEVYQVRQGLEILSTITRLCATSTYEIIHQLPQRAANLSNLNGRIQIYLTALHVGNAIFPSEQGIESEIQESQEWVNIAIRDVAVERLRTLQQHLPQASPVAQNAGRLLAHFQELHPRDYDLSQRRIDSENDIESQLDALSTNFSLQNSEAWQSAKRSLFYTLRSNLVLIPII